MLNSIIVLACFFFLTRRSRFGCCCRTRIQQFMAHRRWMLIRLLFSRNGQNDSTNYLLPHRVSIDMIHSSLCVCSSNYYCRPVVSKPDLHKPTENWPILSLSVYLWLYSPPVLWRIRNVLLWQNTALNHTSGLGLLTNCHYTLAAAHRIGYAIGPEIRRWHTVTITLHRYTLAPICHAHARGHS